MNKALALLLAAVEHAAEISAIFKQMRSEGRDKLTDTEWAQIIAASTTQRDRLAAAIAAATPAPGPTQDP